MSVSLAKVEATAPELVSLVKSAGYAIAQNSLNGTAARVALVLDYSGSMSWQYRSGAMQRLAERVLALALNLDDDGSIDFFVFDDTAARLGAISLSDYRGSVDRLTRKRQMGGTRYGAAFAAVDQFYFGPQKRGVFGRRKEMGPTEPVFAIFLTDGVPTDRTAAETLLRDASHRPIFWKFLSIGSERIAFLESLDDMTGRAVDNADYQAIRDVDALGDDELYALLLEEYPGWLAAVQALGQIA